jgi:hypothetical protein
MVNPISTTWENFFKNIKILSHLRTAYAELQPNLLVSLFSEIERAGLDVQYIYINQKTYSSIRKWGRDICCLDMPQEKKDQGYICIIWGATIALSDTVPDKTVLVVSKPIPGDSYLRGSILNLDEEMGEVTELIKKQDNLKKMLSHMQVLMDETDKHIQAIAMKTLNSL